MTLAAAEADRRLANVVQVGQITAVDNGTSRVRVRIGELDSPWLSVMQIRSGTIRLHWMPAVGEQVTVYAPSGDMARGFVGGSLPIDGNAVAPDAESPTMDLGGGTLRVIGDLFVDGNVLVTGSLVAAVEVTAGDIDLTTHKHKDVSVGAALTGVPV